MVIILDLGYEPHPDTGKPRRKQTVGHVPGHTEASRGEASALLGTARRGHLCGRQQDHARRMAPAYGSASSKPVFGPRATPVIRAASSRTRPARPTRSPASRLQKLRASHIETYYAGATVSASTLTLAPRDPAPGTPQGGEGQDRSSQNPATDLDGKPRRTQVSEDVQQHAWTVNRGAGVPGRGNRRAGAQPAAFYALALDSGARKGELCGLRWADLDLDTGKMHIVQQLLTPGPGRPLVRRKPGARAPCHSAQRRSIGCGIHRKHQAEKSRWRTGRTITDIGLVFAKEWPERADAVGDVGATRSANNLGAGVCNSIKAAGVKQIKFHGLRHTCADLAATGGNPFTLSANGSDTRR